MSHYARALGRPACMYGCDCRRKNPQHWRDYDHPAEHEKLAGSKPLPEVVDLENEPDVDSSIVNLDHFVTDNELARRLQQQEQQSAETASAELARQLARQQQRASFAERRCSA